MSTTPATGSTVDQPSNDEREHDPERPTGERATSDLRQLDAHHSYHEVYHACGVREVGHE